MIQRAFGALYLLASACGAPGGPLGHPEGGVEQAKDSSRTAVTDADWPCWRGPDLDGKSRSPTAPTRWSRTENIVWKANIAGRGHSSPIVCGDRVFLTTADEQTQKQILLAIDRKTGAELWSKVLYDGGFMEKNDKNSHASATPACDGKLVYSVFLNHGALQVSAIDFQGKILWQSALDNFGSEHGYASSPLLYKSFVIVLGDNTKQSFVAALNVDNGKVVWRTDRKTTGRHGSYTSPVVATVAGKPQLLVLGMASTSSYDPATGKLIWTCTGPAEVTACTPAFSEQLVFSSGGYPEKELLAIRADGSGDVTQSHVVWRTGKGVTYVPSPVLHSGSLYVVTDDGIATCFDAAKGTQTWQGRLEGNFSGSPVLVGDLIYATNEAGKTFVFKAGPKLEIVARNELGEGSFATPVICGGQLFLRTERSLYCIGKS